MAALDDGLVLYPNITKEVHALEDTREQARPTRQESSMEVPRFRIPEDVKRKAMMASRSSGAAFWQYTLYRGPNDERVKLHYCRSRDTTERVARLFLGEKVLGFDIEWKPQAMVSEGIRRNVSLIQVAAEERIALFHVALYSNRDNTLDDYVAPTLKHILESPEITKVGVAIKADCTRLRNFLGIDSRGLLELSHLHKLVKHANTPDSSKINKRLVALAHQVEEHLQLPMHKGEVRASDWSRELGRQQLDYAASDSYAGVQLFAVLEAKRRALSPTPPRPAHAELNLPLPLAHSDPSHAERTERPPSPPNTSSTSSQTPKPSSASLSACDHEGEDSILATVPPDLVSYTARLSLGTDAPQDTASNT
ncbi:MAG: hypothetical protein M1832_004100 [Thelocarpon impressellum]|nr:MAG: hypothetical protein M1832_004100 [Thelocarpon impressellum]